MPRGGARPGAGRPKKSASAPKPMSKAEKVLAKAKPGSKASVSAKEFLESVFNSTDVDMALRVRAAQIVLDAETKAGPAASAPGKKAQADAAAKTAASAGNPFAPPAAPKLLINNG
ncbi:hypothetical protein [Paramagnetospirillum marisnigri]|uniref:hypothetical protein n=1 Tax=Paramagnetospirillum marisnigri TaxID=1285242 RepID=UPI001560208A|nr:hypothetical protein [Paramagnetospirillum marisnigri]